MRIRIRCSDGRKTDVEVDDGGTWSDLLTALLLKLDEPVTKVLAGFPAQPIPMTTAPATALSALGIRNGDTLSVATEPEVVETKDASTMVIREMPDDNSCLFNAVGYVLLDRSRSSAPALRRLAAQLVLSDPTYDEAMLGRPPSQYAARMSEPTCWGGAIELSLFARHFGTEIASVDVESGRVDVFGEGCDFGQRVFLLYSGIHYDALALTSSSGDADYDQTVFSSKDDQVLIQALQVAQQARREHRYTNLARFTLRCEQCAEALVGERQAEAHATSTGHTSFVEYS